jgi:hypothetical protein
VARRGEVLSATGTNNANYYDLYGNGNGGYTIGGPTLVGAFGASPGPYGTFDQGGNEWEWSEAKFGNAYYGLHGSSFHTYITGLKADNVTYESPTAAFTSYGFRIAEVPEPTSLCLVVVAAAMRQPRKRARRP